MLSEKERQEIDEELRHCVVKQSASVEALKIVQKHRGWVSDESLRDVAALLDMTHHELDSVATFYNMVFRKPVGRHVVLVCGGVSCWIMDGVTVLDHLRKRLGNRYRADDCRQAVHAAAGGQPRRLRQGPGDDGPRRPAHEPDAGKSRSNNRKIPMTLNDTERL